MTPPHIAAVDVGARANIGWWVEDPGGGRGGNDLDELTGLLVGACNDGAPVALGFEAPLFIPAVDEIDRLGRQRVGERGRPWSAGAGTAALAMGFQQCTYVLTGLAGRMDRPLPVSVDAADLAAGEPVLVLWEAFVSGAGKDRDSLDPHVSDARAAVTEFAARLAAGPVASDIEDTQVVSLVGAAVLAAGLTDDLSLLRQPCPVIRVPDLPGKPA